MKLHVLQQFSAVLASPAAKASDVASLTDSAHRSHCQALTLNSAHLYRFLDCNVTVLADNTHRFFCRTHSSTGSFFACSNLTGLNNTVLFIVLTK